MGVSASAQPLLSEASVVPQGALESHPPVLPSEHPPPLQLPPHPSAGGEIGPIGDHGIILILRGKNYHLACDVD